MKWKIDYSTHNEVIDAQHKELVRIVNELENSLSRDDINIPQNICSVLKCVMYCMELKQSFLKESSCNELADQSHYYCESFKKIFNFFILTQTDDNEKVGFIVQWLESHLINEKNHFSKIINSNTLPNDYKKSNFGNERILLNNKYEKLKYLMSEKLINADDFKENKSKIFIEYLFNLGLQNFNTSYNELDNLYKTKIISEAEKTEYLASFLKKAGTKDALSKINGIDGKLRYLMSLNKSQLISEEKFEEMKQQVLEIYLETKPQDEVRNEKDDIIAAPRQKPIKNKKH